MKLLVIIATVVAFTRAAPMSELQHPSPVNPDVLVDIKPQEKIILMTDPIEIAKFKRETKQPLYPTVSPTDIDHHRSKREHERPNHQQKPRDPLGLQKPQPPKKPSVNQRNRREVEPVKVTQTLPATNAGPIVVEIYQKPLVLPATTEAPATQTAAANNQKPNENDTKEDKVEEVTTEMSTRVQGLPAIFSPSKKQKRDVNKPQNPTEAPKESSNEKQAHECKPEEISQLSDSKNHQRLKRDISVPLVPKHHHSEESSKDGNEKLDSHHESLEVQHDLHHRQEHDYPAGIQKPQILPAIIQEPTTETQQHKPQILPAIIQEPTTETQQHKRDIPVPLVPKHHHPEESQKESNEKDSHENSHHVQGNVPPAGFQNPQILPAIIQEPTPKTQQHKRDIPVPLVPKHHHPEESPKESNEKDSHEDSHHVQGNVPPAGFQKPQILPAIIQEPTPKTQQHKRDIPVPLVPKHHHLEESPKESNEKDSHEDSHHVQEHVTSAGFQKPQLLPAVLNKSPEEVQQHKRDIPVPLVPKHHHPEESPKESNEKHSEKHQDSISHEEFQKPQVLPAILQGSPVETQHKRDIPVPLVPKHHQSEESLKNENVKETHEEIKNTESESHHAQEGFQKPQILPAILTVTSADTQHKRDISVPMNAEQHQPEQSLKQHNDEKNSKNHHNFPQLPQTLSAQKHGEQPQVDADHKDKNEKVAEAQQISQTQPAHIPHYQNHQHIFPQQQTNPENHVVSIPIIHKFQPKEHHLNVENHNLHQSLTAQNNQHVVAEQNHIPKVHNQDQVAATNLQNPPIALGHQNSQSHNPENVAATNLQNIQVVSNHNQEHVEHSGFPKPLTLPTINQHHDVLQKPQPQPTLPMLHQLHDGVEKPEIQPVVNSQIKRDTSANSKIVQQSHEQKREDEHKNQDNHHKPEEVQVDDLSESKPIHQPNLHHVQLTHSHPHQYISSHPNPDEVQVEELSEPKPLHQQHHLHVHLTHSKQQQNIPQVPNPDEVQVEDLSETKTQVHHMQQTNSEHKPNILDDHLSAYNVQSSTTTEHSVIRHQPVSVAELFSRPHDN